VSKDNLKVKVSEHCGVIFISEMHARNPAAA